MDDAIANHSVTDTFTSLGGVGLADVVAIAIERNTSIEAMFAAPHNSTPFLSSLCHTKFNNTAMSFKVSLDTLDSFKAGRASVPWILLFIAALTIWFANMKFHWLKGSNTTFLHCANAVLAANAWGQVCEWDRLTRLLMVRRYYCELSPNWARYRDDMAVLALMPFMLGFMLVAVFVALAMLSKPFLVLLSYSAMFLIGSTIILVGTRGRVEGLTERQRGCWWFKTGIWLRATFLAVLPTRLSQRLVYFDEENALLEPKSEGRSSIPEILYEVKVENV